MAKIQNVRVDRHALKQGKDMESVSLDAMSMLIVKNKQLNVLELIRVSEGAKVDVINKILVQMVKSTLRQEKALESANRDAILINSVINLKNVLALVKDLGSVSQDAVQILSTKKKNL